MKIHNKELVKYASIAGNAQKNGVLIPILNYLLFEEVKGKLVIVGSDLEVTTAVTTDFDAPQGLSVAVNNHVLIDLLKSLPDTDVDIDLGEDMVRVKSSKGEYEIASFPGTDFPKPANLEYDHSFMMPQSDFSEAIEGTLFAVSNDDMRPVMTGLLFDLKGDELVLVATNGHKLVKLTVEGIKTDPGQIIVPSKPLSVIQKGLGVGSVNISFNETNARFQAGNITTYTRLIDGKYPPYDRVIPLDQTNRLTVSQYELSDTIKRVSLFSNRASSTVELKMSQDGLEVCAQDLDYNSKAEEKVPARYFGDDLTISFNSKYLLEVLNSSKAVQFVIHTSEYNKPAVITTSEDDGFLGLVMPTL